MPREHRSGMEVLRCSEQDHGIWQLLLSWDWIHEPNGYLDENCSGLASAALTVLSTMQTYLEHGFPWGTLAATVSMIADSTAWKYPPPSSRNLGRIGKTFWCRKRAYRRPSNRKNLPAWRNHADTTSHDQQIKARAWSGSCTHLSHCQASNPQTEMTRGSRGGGAVITAHTHTHTYRNEASGERDASSGWSTLANHLQGTPSLITELILHYNITVVV